METYDVCITDPPYSKRCQENMCSGSLVRHPENRTTVGVPKYESEFAALTDDLTWLRSLVTLTRRWVVVFCTAEDFGRFQSAVGEEAYIRSCFFYKTNAMGQLTRDRPAAAYEGIAVMHAGGIRKQWNGKGSYGVWRCPGTRGKPDRHPNEKPLPLCLKLVALFSNPGETVFDPFCGSGAIGEAAALLGRGYEGWDYKQHWVDKARERVRRAADAPRLLEEDCLKLCAMRGEDPPEEYRPTLLDPNDCPNLDIHGNEIPGDR